MARKVIVVSLLAITLLLSSCYPQLSVQQYDKLRQDIEALDTERQQLTAQVISLQAQAASLNSDLSLLKAKDAQTLNYVIFMDKLESTQSSGKILSGQFDVDSLLKAKDDLSTQALNLKDSEIGSFLDLMKAGNDSQTVAAYYKIMQICLNKIKQNLAPAQ